MGSRASFTPLTAAFVLCALAASCLPGQGPALEAPSPKPDARPGGRLVVGLETPDGIDPTNAHEPSGIAVARTICDTLIDFDPETGLARPAIAESWLVTDRGRKVTFQLRSGVRFHNGRELTADDVVFTLTRLASEEYASRAADILEPVAGYAEMHGDVDTDDERLTTRLAGVNAVGPSTVEIQLSDSLSGFVGALGHPATAPVPREEAERDPEAFARRPMCAGPYEVAEPWDGASPVVLQRFDDYYAANETYTLAGAGYADEIELRLYPDRESAFAAFETDGLDVVAVPGDALDSARDVPGAQTVQETTSLVEYVGLPVGVAPFDRPAVRAALSVALDRRSIAAVTDAVPAAGFGEMQCPGMSPDADVDPARGLLAEAGIDPPAVRMHFNDEFRNREVAEAVAEAWRTALGLEVELVALGWEEYLERVTRAPGFDGPFRFGWAPPYPSADRLLHPLLHADSIGRNNASRYASRDFSEAIRDARRAIADDDRRTAYERAARAACNDLPLVPVAVQRKAFGVRDTVASAVDRHSGIAFADPLLRELFKR